MAGPHGLSYDLGAVGHSTATFSERTEAGAHRASILAIVEGRADVATIDCRSWMLAGLYEADAVAALSVVGWTARRPGLPYITAKATPPETIAILRGVLGAS